jgi:opacity protein-like surface antigen
MARVGYGYICCISELVEWTMMFRKTCCLFFIIAIHCVSCVCAGTLACKSADPVWNDGLFYGLMAGTGVIYGNQHIQKKDTVSLPNSNTHISIGEYGVNISVLAGFGKNLSILHPKLSKLYLGIDAEVGFDSTDTDFLVQSTALDGNRGQFKSAFKRGFVMAAVGRLGYSIASKAMIYTRLGVARGRYKAEVYDSSYLTTRTGEVEYHKRFSRVKHALRIINGVGIEAELLAIDRVSVNCRGQYDYIYPVQLVKNFIYNNNRRWSSKTKLSEHLFRIGWSIVLG